MIDSTLVPTALLTRCLWLCGQIHRFHEASVDMGMSPDVDGFPPHDVRISQIVMELADQLQVELGKTLEETPQQRKIA